MNFQKRVGFLNTDKIQPLLQTVFKKNFHISSIEQEPVLNLGDVTTLDKPTSKKTVPLPYNFADVIHIDIGYGCSSGLGGTKYALFAGIYPLSSLAEDTLPAIHNLISDPQSN